MNSLNETEPVTNTGVARRAWNRDWPALVVGGTFCAVWVIVLVSVIATPMLLVFIVPFAVIVALPLVVLDVGVLMYFALRKKALGSRARLVTWLPLAVTVAAVMVAFSF